MHSKVRGSYFNYAADLLNHASQSFIYQLRYQTQEHHPTEVACGLRILVLTPQVVLDTSQRTRRKYEQSE